MTRGQILPHGDHSWIIRFSAGTDTTGKRLRPSRVIKGTRADAEKALTLWMAEWYRGTYVSPASIPTVVEWSCEWLKRKQLTVSPATIQGYAKILKTYLEPAYGNLRLDKITPGHLAHLYVSLSSERGLQGTTLKGIHRVLVMLFGDAERNQMIGRSPADHRLAAPRITKRSGGTALTPLELQVLAESIEGHRYRGFYLLLLSAGVRPQEAKPLQVQDLQGRRLTIQRVVGTGADGKPAIVELTKTAAGLRTITLPQAVADVLLQGVPADAKPTDLLLWDHIPDHSTLAKAWKEICKKAGVRQVRLYDTRHTHLSHLLAAGANPRAVAARAGHADPSMVMKVYGHVLPQEDAQLADMGWQMSDPRSAA